MAFSNEYISDADVKKYDLESIDQKFVVGGTHSRDWTIDRDRNIYLRVVTRGREEMAHVSTWTLFRHGDLVAVELELQGTTGGVAQASSAYIKVRRTDLPEHLQALRSDVLADFREALVAYGDGGVFNTATSFH
ncbi:hypothetical protein [Rhizobacter sp. SG703]|uniref:hypothetical protein n=1 Tax=Rhizobacter sp. SG703 TaxID=2587140 RepID=UPI00144796D4|nr:hypothetical protein [Rhizobacter sp. SG703]NKI93551.1 hypothetical protein [Rhizobacter sp. SG703]